MTLKGELLIANGSLFDPNFRQAVVLVAEHGDEGALGVVLNRPGSFTVAEAAPALAALVSPTEPIYIGGPVQSDAAVVLAETSDLASLSSTILGHVGVLGHIPEEGGGEGVLRLRVFAGYAGWGPGQLEKELAESSWIVESAEPDDIFTTEPETLWAEVLRRKGGEFAMLSTMPFDPSHN